MNDPHRPGYLYRKWLRAYSSKKDSLEFYSINNFRTDYTRQELQSKADLAKTCIQTHVDTMVQQGVQISSVLSLACGPGSDLLGAKRAISEARKKAGCEQSPTHDLTEFTGVDLFRWCWSSFVNSLRKDGLSERRTFVLDDMNEYVTSAMLNGLKYDLVILSFAGMPLYLLAYKLLYILSPHGRVFVIDNSVHPLEKFGYVRGDKSFATIGCVTADRATLVKWRKEKRIKSPNSCAAAKLLRAAWRRHLRLKPGVKCRNKTRPKRLRIRRMRRARKARNLARIRQMQLADTEPLMVDVDERSPRLDSVEQRRTEDLYHVTVPSLESCEDVSGATNTDAVANTSLLAVKQPELMLDSKLQL